MTAGHSVPQIRTSLLPTSAMDGAGNIYVVWQTRSFRVGSVASTPNDIAMSVMPAPTDAKPEPAVRRAGSDPDRGRQHEREHERPLHPGDRGRPEHVGRHRAPRALLLQLTRSRRAATLDPENPANQCELRVGFVSSTDGGATWSDPLYLASMGLPDLVRSSQGLMVGDYSTADVIPAGPNAGNAISAFAVGLTDKTLNQPMYVPKNGIPIPFSPGDAPRAEADAGGDRQAKAEGVQRHPTCRRASRSSVRIRSPATAGDPDP